MKWSTMGGKLGTDFDAIEKQMNILGAEGWDLVKVSEVLGTGAVSYTFAIIATFKKVRAG
jgi:hypothetical protein